MTLAADIAHPREPRRCRAVVAVAVVTRGCREIASLYKLPSVHAAFVPCRLVRGNAVGSHVHRITVARAAQPGHVERVYTRVRIRRRSHVVGWVTARTGGHERVAQLDQPLAVDRRHVLGNLVYAQRRVVLPHEPGVGVAATAHVEQHAPARAADESLGRVHALKPCERRVTSVTGDAPEPAIRVHVGGERVDGAGEPLVIERSMAGHTVVHLGLLRARRLVSQKSPRRSRKQPDQSRPFSSPAGRAHCIPPKSCR
jgi:hypothetical protein